MNQPTAFELWRSAHRAPYHFPMTEATWQASMYADVRQGTVLCLTPSRYASRHLCRK